MCASWDSNPDLKVSRPSMLSVTPKAHDQRYYRDGYQLPPPITPHVLDNITASLKSRQALSQHFLPRIFRRPTHLTPMKRALDIAEFCGTNVAYPPRLSNGAQVAPVRSRISELWIHSLHSYEEVNHPWHVAESHPDASRRLRVVCCVASALRKA